MSNNDSEADGATDHEPVIESIDRSSEVPPETGRLLDPWKAEAVEAEDRRRPIPGGEPECPLCGADMVRHVEKHPAPRDGGSPFRVRLVCDSDECGAWTVYDW